MKYARFLCGVALPIIALVVGLLLLANVDSSAKAAEFAGLAVLFLLLFALPTTLIGNILLLKTSGSGIEHFKRGMMLPGVFFVCALIYQSGLWDAIT